MLISLKLIIIYILLYFNIIIIGSECKERWESLRSQYRKNQNKQKTKSSQAASNISNWKYTNQMHFLNEFMKNRSRVTSMTGGNDSDDGRLQDESTNECEVEDDNEPLNQNNEKNTDYVVNEEITVRSNLKTSKLRKKITHTDTKESASTTLMKYLVQQKKEESPHPIDSFFSLMATSVKNFNAVGQHFVKKQLFSLVSDIEAKYVQTQNRRIFQPELTNSCSLQPSPALSNYSIPSASTSYHSDFNPINKEVKSNLTANTSVSRCYS